MNYVVLDMEWNDTAPKEVNDSGIKLVHEIIQVGAAKMDEKHRIIDTFSAYIKPRVYKHIRDDVTMLTGITEEMLSSGNDIKKVMEAFRLWCGDDFIFLTWGPDDIPVLQNNLEFFGISCDWVPFYFNAQALFNMQTENKGRAYSLEYAMEHCNIDNNSRLHDALNDAVYTARVCAGFDIEDGIVSSDEYEGTEFGRIEIPNNEKREISFAFSSIEEAAESRFGSPRCPECGRVLRDVIWYRVNEKKLIADGYCCGDYAVVLTNRRVSEKTFETVKSTYAIDRINEAYFDFLEERAEETEIWQ